MSSLFLGGLIGGVTGFIGPLYEWNENEDGHTTFYGGILHSWGVYYLVVLIIGLFMWAQGMISTDSVTILAAAFVSHCLTAWVIASTVVPILDTFNLTSFVKSAVTAAE